MTVQGEGGSGRRVGRYHLAEPLGAGPTGEVFRAKVYGVAGFERQFAVKRFHPELVSDADRAGLLAQTSRQHGALQHPRIARLHEFGMAGSETFAATELVRGLDLHRLIARSGSRTGLPPGAAAGLVAAAARAVGFAHSRGLAHLGIAPTNLLCTVDGDVKVTDFGHLGHRLSARPTEDPGLSRRVAYLAPEQLRGEPGTTATDVFQLGLIVCELLTGQSPTGSADPRELERRAHAGESAVMALDLPRPLAQVIRRALAVAPADRFPEAAALADALDAAARSSPLPGDRRDLAAVVRIAIDEQVAREGARGGPSAPAAAAPAAATSSSKVGRVTLTGNPAPRGTAGHRATAPRPPVVPPRPETSEETTRVRDDEEVGPPTRVMPEHMVRTLVGQPSPASSTTVPSRAAGPSASRSMTSPTAVVPAATRMAGLASHAVSPPPQRTRATPEAGPTLPSENERETRRREVLRRGTPDAFEREGTDGDFYAVDTVTKQRAELDALVARGPASTVAPSAAAPRRSADAPPPKSAAAARPGPPMRGSLPGSMRVSAEDGLPMSSSLARAESARMTRPTRNTLASSLRAAAEGETRSEDETRVADPLADPLRAALATRADTDGPSPEDETRVADGPLADVQRAALASSRAGTDVNGPEDETRVNPGPRPDLPRAAVARGEPAGARPERGSLAGSLRQSAEEGRSDSPRTTLVGAGRAGADTAPRPMVGSRPLGSGPTQAVSPPGPLRLTADELRGGRPGAHARPDSGTPLPEVKSPPPDVLTPMPELAEMLSLSEVPPRPAMSAPFAPPAPPPPASIAGSAARFAASAARDSRPPAPRPHGPPSSRDSRPPAPLPHGPSSGRDSRPPAPLPHGPPSSRDSRPPAPLPHGPPPARTLFGTPPAPGQVASGHLGSGSSGAPPTPGRLASGLSAAPPIAALSPPAPWQPVSPDPRFALDPASLPDPRPGPGPSMPPPMEPPAIPASARAGRPSGAPPYGEGPIGPPRAMPERAEPMRSPSFTLPEKPGGGLRVALFGLLLAALAGGGYFGYLALYGDGATTASAGAPGRAPAGTAPAGTAASGTAAAGTAASGSAPAGSAPGGASAGARAPDTVASTPSTTPIPPSTGEPTGARAEPTGDLVIESKPERARIYLDGAVVGKTPLTLEANNDRHKLAIIAPGYKPHIAEVDGRGRVSVTLEEVTPPNGPAGIKVRCRQKNRYYVTLDGEPTGQLCPTERLGVELGDHVAEIYDPVTDSRRTYKIKVDQTRLSHRIRVD